MFKNYENVCIFCVRMFILFDFLNLRNFIIKIIWYEKVVDILNLMMIFDEFFFIFFEMVKRNLIGIWNFINLGVVSYNEILEMYREFVDLSFIWKNFMLEE